MVDLVDRQRAMPVALLIVVLILMVVSVVHHQLVLAHVQVAAHHDQVHTRHHAVDFLADVQLAEEVPLVTVVVIHAVAAVDVS